MASIMDDKKRTIDQPEELRKAVQTLYEKYERDKEAKVSYVREMDENDKMKEGNHWDLLGPDGNPLRSKSVQSARPNAVENVTFSLVAGTVSEFAQPVDIVDFPVEKGDQQAAEVLTDLKQFIMDKNQMDIQRLDFNWNFFWHGTGIYEVVWDPSWKGGRGPNRWVGEVRERSVHPRAIFPDARCGKDIQNGRRIHKVSYVPREYVEERFTEYGYLAPDSTYNEEIGGERDSGSATEEVIALVETWYIGEPLVRHDDEKQEGIGLHVLWWAGEGGTPIYLDCANYVEFAESEQPRFPFIFRQRYKRSSDSVWGHGEPYYLKQMQIIHNKTIEIMTEGHIHSAQGQTFYEPGVLDKKQEQAFQQKGSLGGMFFAVNDINRIKRVYGQSMPSSLLQEAQRGPKMMEQQIGRFDISQGRTPGSVTAFRALDLLAQRAQVRLREADVAINSAYKEMGEWINRLVWNHYTERRSYRIIGQDEKGFALKKQGIFRLDDYRKVYDRMTGESTPFNQFVPMEGMVEGEHYEIYSPELDVRCRTSQQMPSDRMFYMEVAKELYGIKLIDPETFFYVLDNGKFPPWSLMAERLQQYTAAQNAPPGAPPGAPVQAPPAQGNIPPELANILASMDQETATQMLQQFQSLPPDQQDEFLQALQSSLSPVAGI